MHMTDQKSDTFYHMQFLCKRSFNFVLLSFRFELFIEEPRLDPQESLPICPVLVV